MRVAQTWVLATIAVAALPGTRVGLAGEPGAVDYEGSFAKRFPAVGTEHHILDWPLYTALVSGDIVTYAVRIDPANAARMETLKGKEYQIQQLEEGFKRDSRLVNAFDDHRRRLKSMIVFVDGDGVQGDACHHPLVYVADEFRLVLGQSNGGAGDPLSHATIAPGCPRVLATEFQITAGRSTRFICWTSDYVTTCGWRLPDMPAALKDVIENIYPGSVKLRWRWRGVDGTVRSRYLDGNGNRVASSKSVALAIPGQLGLEFVDQSGHVLWTAPASAASREPTTVRENGEKRKR